MALIQCSECGGKVSTTAKTCPHCGAEVPVQAKSAPLVPPMAQPSTPAPVEPAKGAKPKLRDGLVGCGVVLVLLACVVILIATSSGNKGPAPAAAPGSVAATSMPAPTRTPWPTPAPLPTIKTTYELRYRVVGGSGVSASLTYRNATGDTEQVGNQGLPWEKTFTVRAGYFAYISAQNRHDSGGLGCEIWLDGVLMKQSSSSGAYVIASCNGTV